MPLFYYKAIDRSGSPQNGSVEALSRPMALSQLEKIGLLPIQLGEQADESSVGWLTKLRESLKRRQSLIGLRDLGALAQSLAALLGAGLTIDRALSIAVALETRPAHRAYLDAISRSLRSGKTFAASLREKDGDLPGYFISMIEAGEAGGSLPETLQRLAELLKRQHEIREKIRSALIYPALLAGVVLVTIVILLTVVLPRFQSLFEESEAPLPWSTQVVLAIGQFMSQFWWLLLLLITSSAFAFLFWYKKANGRRHLDRWLLRSRLTFGLPAALDTARFLRTLSTLLRNGVTLPSALRLVQGTLVNGELRERLLAVGQSVKAGESFSASLARAELFPLQAVQLARVGEETGHLDALLMEAANILDGEAQTRLDRLLSLLVPSLTIVMGLIVAALIGSVLIGLLSINELAY